MAAYVGRPMMGVSEGLGNVPMMLAVVLACMFFCPSIFQSSVGAIVGSLRQIVGSTVVFVASSQGFHKKLPKYDDLPC